MCGICGIVSSDLEPVAPPLLERMDNALLHRGPDGEGFYYRPGVGLAMRRLAVIDLNTGDQPIANEDETLWIVFNGEIYNFPDLRAGLEKRGHRFRTRTDTETVLHLYEEHGPDCVRFLRGRPHAKRIIRHGAVKACVGMSRPTSRPSPSAISLSGRPCSMPMRSARTPRLAASSLIHFAARNVFPVPLM